MWTAVYTLIIMPTLIVLDNAFSLREALRGVAPSWMAQWLLPALILAVIVLLPVWVLWRQKANRHEVMMALFTLMLVSAIILTISGFLFRGPGFQIYWPWQMPNGYNPWDEL